MVELSMSRCSSPTPPLIPDIQIKEKYLGTSKQIPLLPKDLCKAPCQTSRLLSLYKDKPFKKASMKVQTPVVSCSNRKTGSAYICKTHQREDGTVATSRSMEKITSSFDKSSFPETFHHQVSEINSPNQLLNLKVF